LIQKQIPFILKAKFVYLAELNESIDSKANSCKVWLFDIQNCWLIKDRSQKQGMLKNNYKQKLHLNRTDLGS
jgi:hypothetical protein